MTTPDSLEKEHTLRTAAARLDELRTRSALAALDVDVGRPCGVPEALEALALSEVLARKAQNSRQLDTRAARTAGASWVQIGAALGVSRQAAWESHDRWITTQAALHRDVDHEGLTPAEVDLERTLAGLPQD
ncbi:MAG: hypothetical protein JWO60_1043 [Frankiales bacterium]|nr:hypothetical protein [Frankiales bacterium]